MRESGVALRRTPNHTSVASPDVIDLTVVRRRRPGRIASALVLLVLGVLVIRSVATNPRFQWEVVGDYLTAPSVIHGLVRTLELTVIAMSAGVALGTVLAIMRLSPNVLVSGCSSLYIWFFRGTPLLVQIIFWYNIAALYPSISVGVPFGPSTNLDANALISPLLAAVLALSLNEAAYMAEIIRAGIRSIDEGQTDAALALGMTRARTTFRIILPQAMRLIVPPTGNETIGMLKTTALVSVISVSELTFSVQSIYSRTFETIPLLIVASIWYLAATSVLMVVQSYIERRFARGASRELAPTTLQRIAYGTLARLRMRRD